MKYKESFLEYLQYEKHYSHHTVCSYKSDLEAYSHFLNVHAGSDDPLQANSSDIRSWVVSMMDSGYSASSVHRKISGLRSFYRYLRRDKLISNDPLDTIILPKRRKRLPVFVEEASMDKLLDQYDFGNDFFGVRDKTIIEMLYLTGMRRAELIGLRDKDIDFEGRNVKVTGKRKKERIIPLTESFILNLEKYLSLKTDSSFNTEGDWFFVTALAQPAPSVAPAYFVLLIALVYYLQHVVFLILLPQL